MANSGDDLSHKEEGIPIGLIVRRDDTGVAVGSAVSLEKNEEYMCNEFNLRQSGKGFI